MTSTIPIRNNTRAFAFIIVFVLIFIACNSKNKKIDTNIDTPEKGIINVSIDESFRPVMDEQITMYESSFPGARIIPHYKPEAECLKDILRDSGTRMVIVTRGLNGKEESYFKDSLNYIPRWDQVASDAIAAIVNINSADTVFTTDRLRKQLSGKMGKEQSVVFDGLNATSTIRYAMDSILKGEKFDTTVVKAVNNSRQVLEYVAAHENAIGMVGISWIGNPEDTSQLSMLKKVKMAYVKCDRCPDTPYVKPTQLGIMAGRYPLVRGLFYILKENYTGLGSGFVNFLQYERGQLIFRRAYLGPTKMGFAIRDVKINEKIKND